MRTYEMMVIIDGDLDESEVSAARNDLRRRVADVAEIVDETFWGRREFAYEINHKRHGFYAILEMAAEPGALDPVERALRIDDNVVRHKLIRLPDEEAERRAALRAAPAPEEPPAEPPTQEEQTDA